jgi:hypothetical protein
LRLAIVLTISATCAGFALCAGQASAGDAKPAKAAPVAQLASSFQDFCAQWLAKLDKRERFNQKKAKKTADGEYIAYGDVMIRCEAKPNGDSSRNAIGRLVYYELRVRDGAKKAAKSQPDVLSRTEVMEIFRFDGKAWLY